MLDAQKQTYVLDVRDLRGLPPMTAQAFTDDNGRFGSTLQQRIELGGAHRGGRGGVLPRGERRLEAAPGREPQRARGEERRVGGEEGRVGGDGRLRVAGVRRGARHRCRPWP